METTAPTHRETGDRDHPGRWRAWRDRRASEANARTEQVARTRAAAVAAASRRDRTVEPVAETDADLAPVPRWLRWVGVWADRTIGTIPLAAPLLVSGAYTVQVFTDAPLNAHLGLALLVTTALEGGVWKLARLYEKTLVDGDSTIALRLGIGVYLAIISGLIYWHADVHGADWRPALGVAVMSTLGVFIWSRTARWQRRAELRARGRVDRQAPKFAALAWLLTPVETPKALRHAVKYRIESPVDALADRRLFVAAGKPAIWPPLETGDEEATEDDGDRGGKTPDGDRRETPEPPPNRQSKTGGARQRKSGGRGSNGTGRLTDDQYVAKVRRRYPDWADPNRSQRVSATEVMVATGLRGKPVALRIQRLLYGETAPSQTSGGGSADDIKEEQRDLVGA